MTTTTEAAEMAEIIAKSGCCATGSGPCLSRRKRRLIAAALRELAEIKRREEGRVPSRPATADEIGIARDLYEHPSNADCSIPPDARAWETAEEIRVEASVLVKAKR